MSTISFPIELLSKMPRPPEYMAELRAVMLHEDADLMYFDNESAAYLALQAKYRSAEYRPAVEEWKRIATAKEIQTVAERIQAKLPPRVPPPPVEPVPYDDWPKWARLISAMKTDEDVGLGATVKRMLGTAGAAFKATMKLLGAPCGCANREAEWNAKYPY